jgi:hypothetical protein
LLEGCERTGEPQFTGSIFLFKRLIDRFGSLLKQSHTKTTRETGTLQRQKGYSPTIIFAQCLSRGPAGARAWVFSESVMVLLIVTRTNDSFSSSGKNFGKVWDLWFEAMQNVETVPINPIIFWLIREHCISMKLLVFKHNRCGSSFTINYKEYNRFDALLEIWIKITIWSCGIYIYILKQHFVWLVLY